MLCIWKTIFYNWRGRGVNGFYALWLWHLQHKPNRWALSSLYSGEEEERPVVQGFLCMCYGLTSENFKMIERRTHI